MRAASGWAARGSGVRLRASPPRAAVTGAAPGAGLRAGLGSRGRQGTLRRGGGPPPARPLPRGAAGVESESEPGPRTLRPGRGVAQEEAGWEGWAAGGRCQRAPPGLRAAHAAGTPRRLLKSGPPRDSFPPFLLHCRSGKNVGAGRG